MPGDQGSNPVPQMESNKAISGACREKYWEECDDAEKLDRLRDVMMRLNEDNVGFAEAVGALMAHQHGSEGQLLTPINLGANDRQTGYAGDRVYRIRTEYERGNKRRR